jgi:hypothetical protein
MNSNFGKTIQKLIDENVGDQHRLEDMQKRITLGRNLYNSDILYLKKLTELVDDPVVFGEEPFVFEKETKIQAVKGIVKQTVEQTAKLAVEQTVEQTSKLITKRTIPVKLIIILSSLIVVSGLAFLAVYFQLLFLPDILIYNQLHDLFFTNIILPMCDMELYWNPCHILN